MHITRFTTMKAAPLLLLIAQLAMALSSARTIIKNSSTIDVAFTSNTSMNTTLFALLSLKQAIFSSDPTSFLALWSTLIIPNYCDWRGVRCAPGTHNVIALLLDSNQLNGTLPPQLNQLSHLTYLNISNNSFHGFIPPELGQLSSLTQLDLSSNQFTGSIPSSLANCTRLEYLNLGINSLSSKFPSFVTSFSNLVYLDMTGITFPGGEIPPDIGLLSNLEFLRLSGCSLTGGLPPSITNCTRLVWMNLRGNNLTGPLPLSWSKFAHVQHIHLRDNFFTGSIPSTLGNCTTLTQLYLENNSLKGELPESLSRLGTLQYLTVFHNNLHGPIPSSIVNCTQLMSLQLGHNNLTGRIPWYIGKLKELKWLSLTGATELSGVIPDTIGDCTKLQTFTVSFTEVGGSLPQSICNLSNLQTLVLSSCRFTGSLTGCNVQNLTALVSLSLNRNTFHGKIPVGLGQLKELQGLELQHNRFEGPIPQLWQGISISQLDFSYNSLTGNIPASMGDLNHLNKLYLRNNGLSGAIPDFLESLNRLQDIDLSHNNLTGQIPPTLSASVYLDLSFNDLWGTIPPSMGSMHMVTTIKLAGNRLAGEVPDSLGGCQGLQVLDLSMNILDGMIPSALGQLRAMQYMNLSHNRLSGALPPSLSNLHGLVSLNVSFNKLQGMIPFEGVFKNSSANAFLGNPGLCGYPLNTSCGTQSPHFKARSRVLIISLCTSIGGLVLLVCACSIWWWSWRSSSGRKQVTVNVSELEWFGRQKPHLRAWTATELRAATNGFDSANIIGTGGASVCFKGVVNVKGTRKLVAIKRLNTKCEDGIELRRNFVQELQALGQVIHRNLVKPLGYCIEQGELALVMEFMELGSLDELLHMRSPRSLCWERRLRIAVDVADGLVYLHHESIQPLIHCDLKPGNILLGSDMVAKISDFGIAKLLECNETGAILSTSNFAGTFGYAAPECGAGFGISTKADVYSYGVLLIELVTGMKPTSPQLQECGMTSHTWCRSLLLSKRASRLVDIVVQEAMKKDPALSQKLEKLLDLGAKCTHENPKERPNMKDVRKVLIQITNPKL